MHTSKHVLKLQRSVKVSMLQTENTQKYEENSWQRWRTSLHELE